jgi:4-hydroxy-2-oxoheptanedioate aldolase
MPAKRFRDCVKAKRPYTGAIVNFTSSWFIDMIGLAGFDFVVLDAEHGPLTPETAETMIRAAEAAGIDPIVRVPANVAHEILRYLDVGAAGVQVPHLDTVEEVRAAVAAVRYPPAGQRGLAPITRAAKYGIDEPVPSYVERMNRELLCWAMVETAEAVENIDAILRVRGVDAIVIGPGDLASAMGYGGDRSVPAVKKAVQQVVDRCRAVGMPVALPAANAAAAKQCVEQGANIIQVPSSAWIIQSGRAFMHNLVPVK